MEEVHWLIPGKLKIIQNHNFFKFGNDSVFLANYTRVRDGALVVDLGCGSGVIPLLLAFKQNPEKVIGIEIQSPLVDMARRSVKMNKMEDKIEIIEGDLKKVNEFVKPESVDVVVSNPPYTPVSGGKMTKNKEIAIAKHEIKATLEDVIGAADKILRFGGIFTMVHRARRLAEMIVLLKKYNLEPKRLNIVQSRHGTQPKTVIVEAIKGAREGLEIDPVLIVYKGNTGEYTNKVKRMYGEDISD